MSAKQSVVGLIVAAGKGERAGGDTPKQYRALGDTTVLGRAVQSLTGHPDVESVHVVIGEGQEDLFKRATEGLSLPSPIIGGASRQQSVRNGLEAISNAGGAEIVLIHDAARPVVPSDVVDRLLAALASDPGAIPVLPVSDSLVRTDGTTVDRSDFAAVQTPQAFRFEAILSAHRNWPEGEVATDDAAIARMAGHRVALVEGDPALKKLTFAEDFAMADALPDFRTGMGYDVHAFEPGDSVWLGGVEIAHDRKLAGHSDADVALHALTDAVLGAIGAGDIGDHFPPSDPQWAGAPSHRFLEHAAKLANEAGFAVCHVDLTIICEAPKIGPHRAAMRAAIAEMLAIAPEAVSVKATTTEGLGFTGRKEGIAAQAVATLARRGTAK